MDRTAPQHEGPWFKKVIGGECVCVASVCSIPKKTCRVNSPFSPVYKGGNRGMDLFLKLHPEVEANPHLHERNTEYLLAIWSRSLK